MGRLHQFVFLAGLLCASSVRAQLYDYRVESGTRLAASGDEVPYDLFIPVPPADAVVRPAPAVILTHGFGSNKFFHRNQAIYMVRRGMIVMTPNLVRLFTGESQLRNIDNTVGHLEWLAQRTATPGDELFSRLDPARLGLAGHSAGGAVSFEAAAGAQERGLGLVSLVLLDAVPWPRTVQHAGQLAPLWLSSLRGEPHPCNAGGNILTLLPNLTFPTVDTRIIGGSHCDPLNPGIAVCNILCGDSPPGTDTIFARLMYLFFRDTFGLPELGGDPLSYAQALALYELTGKARSVAVTPVSP